MRSFGESVKIRVCAALPHRSQHQRTPAADVTAQKAQGILWSRFWRFHLRVRGKHRENFAQPGPRSVDILRPLFEAGVRWETSTAEEIATVRRFLLRMPDHNFVEAMKLLASNDYCSPTILHDLGRTTAMHMRMKKVGFLSVPPEDAGRYYQSRPPRSREVLS